MNDFGAVRIERQRATRPFTPTRFAILANDNDLDCSPTYVNERGAGGQSPPYNPGCTAGDIWDYGEPHVEITRGPHGRGGVPVNPADLDWSVVYDPSQPSGLRTQIEVVVRTDDRGTPAIRGFDIRYRVRDSRGIWSNEATLDVTVRTLAPT